ncbi:hypothetical protein OS493_007258, partial [Desmophyllum pertusum]
LMFTDRCWWYWYTRSFKFCLVLLVIVVAIGEFGCFLWVALFSWRIPETSSGSLNLLFFSDSQIQGYNGELSGILGFITRFDSDWYLKKTFLLAWTTFYPDAIIHLGDMLDEGSTATDDQFQEYKARHDTIFNTADGISRIHIAGDNDIGGEWSDIITEETVSRFSENFGAMNDVIKLKSFQIVKINSVSLLRGKPFTAEQTVYNKTMAFIDELPTMLDKDKMTILIGHVPFTHTSKKQQVPVIKLIDAVQPRYAFSGHIHKAGTFQHKIGSVTFTEYVVPTCSYRMGTDKMGAAVAVLGADGSIDFSVLSLPSRYPFFHAYLVLLCICMLLALPWLISRIMFIVRSGSNIAFLPCRIQFNY